MEVAWLLKGRLSEFCHDELRLGSDEGEAPRHEGSNAAETDLVCGIQIGREMPVDGADDESCDSCSTNRYVISFFLGARESAGNMKADELSIDLAEEKGMHTWVDDFQTIYAKPCIAG